MELLPRKIYTYEFKLEAMRLVESGQSIVEAARKDEVIDWMLWYNQKRMHSTIVYQSPVEFEQAWLLQ
jgi:transposase InsO family protein